jgi:hypothetical protein
MSYVCIITVSQDSCIRDGERNQVSRPIYSSVEVFLTRLREQITFSDFRRWLSYFVVIVGLVPHISPLVSPGPLRVAGESMDKYDAFQ